MAKFDEGLFGSAKFDTIEHSAVDVLSLADALTRRAQLANADALSVTDQMSKAARAVFGDVTAVSDAVVPRNLVLFQDAVTLADGILKLTQAIRDDSLTLTDDLEKQPRVPVADAASLADAIVKKAQPSAADVAALADALAGAVAAFRTDTLELADAISSATGISLADTVSGLDAMAAAVARGAEAEALEMADDLVVRALLATNDFAGSINRCLDFSFWTLSGGAYLEEDGTLVLPQFGSSASSPLIIMGRAANWWWSADFYSDHESNRGDWAGQASFLQGSSYFNINAQAAANSAGWTGNGNAQAFPIGEWSRKVWSYVGGNNVAFIRMNISSNSTWSSPHYKVRNPKLAIVNDTAYTPYGIDSILAAMVGAGTGQDEITAADAITKAVSRSVTDLLAVVDAISRAATFLRSEADAASALDAVGIASMVRRTLTDIATLADAIRAAVAAQKPLPASFGGGAFDESVFDGADGEMVALSESLTWRTIFGALATDLLDLADAIQYEARLAKANAAGLTDASQARIGKEATDSATVADALALAVQLAKTDSLVLADAIVKAANVVAADPVALADSWATAVQAAFEDVVALADDVSTAAVFRGTASDTAALVDAVGKFVRTMAGEDTAALTDALAGFWFGKSATDAASLLDAVITAIRATATDALTLTDNTNAAAEVKKPAPGSFGGGQFDDSMFDAPEGDPATLADAISIAAVYKRLAEDLAELADAVAAQVRARAADAADLADQHNTRMASVQDDLIAVADALLRAIAAQLTDNAGLTDSTRYGLARALADALASADMLDQAAVTKAVSDVLALGDEELAKVGASREDLLALADLLAALAGVPKADSTNVADEVVIALHLARQAEDFLGMMDSLMKRLQAVLESVAELEDDLVKGMRIAQEEALDLFEVIGAGVARPLPEDAVGILDEKRLRVVLGLESAVSKFTDSAWVVVKQVLSQVWINGLNVPVTGLQITHSSTNRVSECRFSILNPSAEVLGLAVPRADIKVYLVDGGHTEYFGGRIVDNPVKARSNTGVQLDVTVLDYTAAASDVFVTEVFTETRTGEGELETPNKSLITILKEIWQRYYPYPINLDHVVTAGDRVLPKLVFKYDTLFEATERIARLLGGWSWFVEWDGGQHILRFFPLQGNIKDTVFSVANRNVVAGTARFGQDSRLCNAITVIGGSMLSEVRQETWIADGVKAMYQIPKNWREVSVKVNGVPQTKGAFYLHDKWAYDCLHDPEGVIVWREDNKPAQGALIEWTIRYERPVMAYLEDPTSIRQFGRVEERVVNSKIQDPVLARQLARQTIKERAFPVGYGAMEILESRVRAGDFVKVDLHKYNAQGYYEIKEVERKVVGARIKRTIALGLASDPYHLIAERIREIMGRLAELEQRELGEDAELMRVTKYAEGAQIIEVVAALKETPEGVWRFGDSAARFGYSEWA